MSSVTLCTMLYLAIVRVMSTNFTLPKSCEYCHSSCVWRLLLSIISPTCLTFTKGAAHFGIPVLPSSRMEKSVLSCNGIMCMFLISWRTFSEIRCCHQEVTFSFFHTCLIKIVDIISIKAAWIILLCCGTLRFPFCHMICNCKQNNRIYSLRVVQRQKTAATN
jgi:hypothetical protein